MNYVLVCAIKSKTVNNNKLKQYVKTDILYFKLK